MALTKEQKDFILKRLNSQWYPVKLECDGYIVHLKLERVQDLKLAVEVYVNSFVKGEWLVHPDKHVESKFFPSRFVYVISPAKKKQAIKRLGKKRAYEFYPDLDKKIEYKGTHFSSGKTALNHLIKVSGSIELITEMENETALA